MPTTAQMAAFRAAQQASMTLACTVRTPGTPASDGHGGATAGTPVDVTTVCRRAPTAGAEIEIAARLTERVTATFVLPYGTTIDARCQIVVGSTVYDVIAVLDGDTNATALRVLAVENG